MKLLNKLRDKRTKKLTDKKQPVNVPKDEHETMYNADTYPARFYVRTPNLYTKE
jgi:hypothetical protein